MPVADLIRQVGISEQTFYRWKKQYAGMQSDQVRELKQLQEENARLKACSGAFSGQRAILHAAEHPVSGLYVGGSAKLLAMSAYCTPRLVDCGMRRLIFRLQKMRKPSYPESRHNLHSPSQDMKDRSSMDALSLSAAYISTWQFTSVRIP
jgi:hypothetical protein